VGLVTINGGAEACRARAGRPGRAGRRRAQPGRRPKKSWVAANVNQPKGKPGWRSPELHPGHQRISSRAPASFRPLILAYNNGAPIRLQEVANVIDGVENDELAGWSDGRRAIIVSVRRQPGANVIEVADRVKALLPRLYTALPRGWT